ncbi:MAG: hypothetical protein U9Q71_03240, partial [Pseudomonadota bacterium]|nr:hypothetical protein [Pseudomonadota bacterium]
MLYQATNSETVENIVNKGAPISPSILSGLAGFIETLILLASGYGLGLALLEGIHHNYWIVILPATALIVSWRSMDGAYDYRHIRGAPRHPGRVFIFSSLLFLGIKTFAPFITLGYEITYTWLFSWLFSGFIAIMVVRAWVY